MSGNIAKLLLRTRKQLLRTCTCRSMNSPNYLNLNYNNNNNSRLFCSENEKNKSENTLSDEKNDTPGSIDQRYKIFRDEETNIVFDVTEELDRIQLEALNAEEEYRDPYEGLNMTRGKTGVFDIEDLVDCLKRDNARNIFVAKVPKEWAYVDYIVIVTAKSVRHMNALMTFIRKAYKIKRYECDKIPAPEGKKSREWQAIDLGNIALHIFIQETRERFDLETLWTVGSKYDDLTINKENVEENIESYNSFLQEYEPAESEIK